MWDWTLVFLWCGRTGGLRAVYGHVINKFSRMGRFTYPWCSAGALRAPELRYKSIHIWHSGLHVCYPTIFSKNLIPWCWFEKLLYSVCGNEMDEGHEIRSLVWNSVVKWRHTSSRTSLEWPRVNLCRFWPGGGTPHMKGVGMLVGNVDLNPKGDRSGRGPSFFWPLKETMLKHRQYIYFYFFRVQP